MTRAEGCPSDLDLERALVGEPVPAAEHLKTCAHCAPRVAQMRELGVRFSSVVFPKLREAVGQRTSGAGTPWWRWLLPALAPVAALLLAVVLWPKGPSPGYVGMKGGGSLLEVYVGEGNQGRQLAAGERVHPGDGLRFVVISPTQTAFVFTVDSTGRVSRLYPTSGEGPAPVSGLLPGGAILDEITGPERVFAVYPRGPMTFAEVEAAVAATFTSPEAVRSVARLPIDGDQQSLLLEKVPR